MSIHTIVNLIDDSQDRRRPLWRYVFVAILVVASIGIVTSMLFFSSWGQIESATFEEATMAFEGDIARAADQRAYVIIAASGKVEVRRELEQQHPSRLTALHLLAYEPGTSRLVRMRFPFWFVQVKTSDSLNLGTLVSLLSKDWENLDLSVTEDDLMHRGPGLVLDHTRANGGRILLWSE